MSLSRHHVLHERTAWMSRPDARDLRTTHSLIPNLERDLHDELHFNCPPVPLLGSFALREINQDFYTTNDTNRDIDQLMLLIEKAGKHPRAHPLETRLAGLAVQALYLQRPFIWRAQR